CADQPRGPPRGRLDAWGGNREADAPIAELGAFVCGKRVLTLHRQTAIPPFARFKDSRTKGGRCQFARSTPRSARDKAPAPVDDAADPAVGQTLLANEILERVAAHERREHVHD